MANFFIARHPIFDKKLDIIGYNLILKEYEHLFSDTQITSSQIVVNTLMQLDIAKLTPNALAFIPLTPALIENHTLGTLNPQQYVFEINKAVCQKNDFVDLIRSSAGNGYQFAYDGYEIIEKYTHLAKFIKYVKIDIAKHPDLDRMIGLLSELNVITVAKNVKTLDDFDTCKEYGFQLYQGFFICQPNLRNAKKISSSRLIVLKLLSKLYEPDVEMRDLAESIQSDVTLSYKLLRLINSVYFSTAIKIESILHALTLLGINKIRNWASLLLLSDIVDKPNYIFFTALERAKMCETLCATLDKSKKDPAFLVGLLSVIDTMFDMPMEEVLSSLPMSEEINEALLDRKGLLGSILLSVISYQQGNWIESMLSGFEPDKIRNAFLESIDWVTSVSTVV